MEEMEGDYAVVSRCSYKWKSQQWEVYRSIFHGWRKMERPFWILDLIVPFLGKIWLQVGQDGKSSQYYPVNASVPQNSIFGPTFFLPYTDLLDDVICNTVKSVKIVTMTSRHKLPLIDEINKLLPCSKKPRLGNVQLKVLKD